MAVPARAGGSGGRRRAVVGSSSRPVRVVVTIIAVVWPVARTIPGLGALGAMIIAAVPGSVGGRAIGRAIIAVASGLIGARPEMLVRPLGPLPEPGMMLIIPVFSLHAAMIEPLVPINLLRESVISRACPSALRHGATISLPVTPSHLRLHRWRRQNRCC